MKKYLVKWSETISLTPYLTNGRQAAEFDNFEDALVFYKQELERTANKSMAEIEKENPNFFDDDNETSEYRCSHHRTFLEVMCVEDGEVIEDIEQSDGYWVEN